MDVFDHPVVDARRALGVPVARHDGHVVVLQQHEQFVLVFEVVPDVVPCAVVGHEGHMAGHDELPDLRIKRPEVLVEPCELLRGDDLVVLVASVVEHVVEYDVVDLADVERVVGRSEILAVFGFGLVVVFVFVAVVVVADDVVHQKGGVLGQTQVLGHARFVAEPVFRVGHVAQIEPVDRCAPHQAVGVLHQPGHEVVAELDRVDRGDDVAASGRDVDHAARDVFVGHHEQGVIVVGGACEVEVELLHLLFARRLVEGVEEFGQEAGVDLRVVAARRGDHHELRARELGLEPVAAFGVGLYDVETVGDDDPFDASPFTRDIAFDRGPRFVGERRQFGAPDRRRKTYGDSREEQEFSVFHHGKKW